MASFEMAHAVLVNIDCTQDIGGRFLRFCIDKDIVPYRLGQVGPNGIFKVYPLKHAEEIRAWLETNDVKDTA